MGTNECYVYFALDGESFEPNDVTNHLGIQPTSVMRKGEKIPNKLPVFSSWQLSTENVINEIIDVDELASKVIQVLEPKVELINEIKSKLNLTCRLEVVLCITTDDSQSTPAVGFEAKNIKFLANIGANIDIDTYRT